MDLCDVILRTNRVRCALNMEILDLLNEESVSVNLTRSPMSMFEKVSRSLKYDSNFFFVHRHIYIYIWTPQSITLTRSRCACGVTRRSVEHCTPHVDSAWLNELGWSQL